MIKAIAFFPWVITKEPKIIGPIRLLPWEKGRIPIDLENAKLQDIDDVLSAYANRPAHQIKTATLLEYGNWRTGMGPQDYIADLFFTRQLIGFSALSSRPLFRQRFDYCNYDTYSLIVQKYNEGDGGRFAFITRRRDGESNQSWSTNEFAFHRPYHVEHSQQLKIDERLLNVLALRTGIPDHFYSAIREFNLANTDSTNIPEHIEMVMMKSAFEWLFQINQSVDEFIKALKNLFSKFECEETPDTEVKQKWLSKQPGSCRLIECWAKDFCDLRGLAAHGNKKKTDRFVWREFWHLAFASILFPLLLKAQLANLGKLKMDSFDIEHVKYIEHYLAIDPNFSSEENYSMNHPWQKIENNIQRSLLKRDLHDAICRIDST